METSIPPAKTVFAKTSASVLLDLIRGLAAILVLIEHWRALFFVDFGQIARHRALLALPYLLTSAGHQAVVIFFVLSGYLISGSVLRMVERGTWSWLRYLTHRLMRLWVVLIPGLLLCALWDGLALHMHVAPALYGGAGTNHMTPDVRAVYTVPIFIQNVFFLQIVRAPVFGSDGPLWSLAYEFWYYILFPLGLLAYLGPKLITRIVCGVLFVIIACLVGRPILLSFPIWLLGTVLVIIPVPRMGNLIRVVTAILYLPILFMLGRLHLPSQVPDYLLGVATFVLLWVMLSATGEAPQSVGSRTSRELSRFSYTLYVAHLPFGVFLTALIAGDSHWTPDPVHILKALAVLVLLLGYCYALAFCTEFHTDRWRRWVELRLGLSRPEAGTLERS